MDVQIKKYNLETAHAAVQLLLDEDAKVHGVTTGKMAELGSDEVREEGNTIIFLPEEGNEEDSYVSEHVVILNHNPQHKLVHVKVQDDGGDAHDRARANQRMWLPAATPCYHEDAISRKLINNLDKAHERKKRR